MWGKVIGKWCPDPGSVGVTQCGPLCVQDVIQQLLHVLSGRIVVLSRVNLLSWN